MITITPSAVEYIKTLIADKPNVAGVRITVRNGGTARAETQLSYSKTGDQRTTDRVEQHRGVAVYIDTNVEHFLEAAVVDYDADKFGGNITIKAPNSYAPALPKNATLEQRVQYFLDSEVNPGLAAHRGSVKLAEITSEKVAVLEFGGGCQGCSQVSNTLKFGVEGQLLEKFADHLTGVKDSTDHQDDSNAFFK